MPNASEGKTQLVFKERDARLNKFLKSALLVTLPSPATQPLSTAHKEQRAFAFNWYPVDGVLGLWTLPRCPYFAARANLKASTDQTSAWSRCSPAPSWSRHRPLDYTHTCCTAHQKGSHLQREKERRRQSQPGVWTDLRRTRKTSS